MSSPGASSPGQRGFTLLDCEIAIIVLSLLSVGVMNRTRSHEQVVRSLEKWHEGRSVYYVVQPEDPIERLLGVPARMSADGNRTELLGLRRPFDVNVIEARLDLVPPGGWVLVELVRRPPEEEG